jgi:hypothetical protein
VCGCAGRTKLSRSWLKQLKVRRPDLYDIAQSLAGNGDGAPPRPHDVSWDPTKVGPSQSRCTRLSLTKPGLAKTGRTTAEAELEGILEERREKKERKKAKKRARKEAKKGTRT